MSDIELVIKISEEEYDLIVNDEACGLNVLTRAIANGTPLPKGHGRIIDESNITSCEWDGKSETMTTNAPTIIEADKAETENP